MLLSKQDVTDDVCPDSEYGTQTSPDKFKAISKPPLPVNWVE